MTLSEGKDEAMSGSSLREGAGGEDDWPPVCCLAIDFKPKN